MKDRQLAKRIQHQFAKYDSAGRLTCTLCNCLTVKSEALWPSHLSSKPHRLNYQNYQNKAVEAQADQKHGSSTPPASKRKPDELSPDNNGLQGKKVRFDDASEHGSTPRPSLSTKSSLPADFFDDASQAPTHDQPLEEDDEQQQQDDEDDDPEWSAFKAALEEPAPEDTSANLFARASMIAEPVLYESVNNPAGILPSQEDPGMAEDDGPPQQEEEEEEDPIEKKIREEKEEIMDRIQNEEREQLEADQRVLRMKARLNAFRASRKKAPLQ